MVATLMIRHRRGSEFLLITQDDHARLSGQLAGRIGGSLIAKPAPPTIDAIALHDSGWPLHDDLPTLNDRGEPLHVFETPPKIATQVWAESVVRASGVNPYTGLLVSLHVVNLSAMSAASHKSPHDRFELNKFQHRQIEIQEELRRRLGLRIDMPLTYGLAPPGTDQREDELLYDYHLLRAMDQLSLALLCREDLFPAIDGLIPRPGASPLALRLERRGEFTAHLDPWPFDAPALEFSVPTRRLPAEAFEDQEAFRRAYRWARTDRLTVSCSTSDPVGGNELQ